MLQVFLDGVVPYGLGCHTPDVNCTGSNSAANCSTAALEARWEQLYIAWFAALKAKWPQLLWVNNVVDSLQPSLINVSNGRSYSN